MDSSALITLTSFFASIIGDIPSELMPVMYIVFVIVVLFCIESFMTLLFQIFGVTKWKR